MRSRSTTRYFSWLIPTVMLALGAPGLAMAHHCKGGHANDPGCDGGGGGGGGGDDTSALLLVCSIDGGGTLFSDGLGDYTHDVDQVRCSTGDSQAVSGTSRLVFDNVVRGNIKNAVRKVDIAIDENTCTDATGCAAAPDSVFESALGVFDDMEDARFAVQAYSGTDGLVVPHIQKLTPGQSYEVSMDFSLKGTAERWVFQMLGRELPDDFKQGLKCHPENPADAVSDDVTLYVWPDGDSDGRPDGFTVTTAAALNTGSVPPTVATADTRTATLCSNVGTDGSGCGGPGSSDLCHVISQMEVQFTWHAVTQ